MAAPAALPPFEPPLGPQPLVGTLYSPQQVTLVLREKVFSLSGDTFTVQTAEGVNVLQVKGKVASLHSKKTFTDMSGAEIFVLAEKKLKLFKTFHAESPAGHNFDVEGHFSIGSSKSTVKFVNAADKAPIELQVKGDWFDRKASITLGDRVVAQISRSFANAREIFGNKQTYFVTVAPGVDLSLIAALCVAIDERENEK
ncbi:uncharacterized protein RHO25_000789 [Cercospora beticola]|uniref:Protein LURP-one-related 15 n=1 Tax=Cercospora beticola TaxID=122368 RepID=A0ABZ0N9I6_CERBT|nr:hypothetical protein RHO25_000789 [Cercospora beticola]CAK1355531.1 unnamed protein product [Cercospora beticola]